jgi:hypothetical protein
MAIFTASGVVGSVSGRLGGVVFAGAKSGPVVRARGRRVGGETDAALVARTSRVRIARAWQALSDGERRAWGLYAAAFPGSNRLGVRRQVSGWQVYSQYVGLVYNGDAPASLVPPQVLPGYAPTRLAPYFLEGGPYAVSVTGTRAALLTTFELCYLQRGLAPVQTTGFQRLRRLPTIVRSVSTQDWGDADTLERFPVYDGLRVGVRGRWYVGGGWPGAPGQGVGVVGSVPWTVDDFERAALAYYVGATTRWSISGTAAHDGTYGLLVSMQAGDALANSIVSVAGLDVYPLPGHSFQCWEQMASGTGYPRVFFGVVDVNNGFFVEWLFNGNAVIQKRVAGVDTILVVAAWGNFTVGNWYRWVVSWSKVGEIVWTCYTAAGALVGTVS